MDHNDLAVFAETNFRNRFRKFGIKTDDRRRHMYLIGKTGMGKSTVLENMIVDDIKAGKGVAVVDPHGDLAEKIIEFIPTNRINDVIYFNPSDINYPIAFNVVEQVEAHLRHLVASGLIGVFQKLWADSWGPRLEYILRNAILAILDYPDSTLMAVIRMLSDKVFRTKVIDKIQDPVVKAFWVNEFAGYADKFASEAVSPIQNKVGQFLSSSLIRNIVGQVKSSIDMRKIMDEGKILILNLSKGRIGEDNSALLGAMMITKIQLAAMSRVDLPETERKDFILYVDEFQNFTSDSFANILSEARKYRLSLVLAHQYIEQLSEKVKPAVFGNVGTMIVFRVGAADAEELVKEFTPIFTEEDIVNLPKYQFYLKLMIDGVASDPFSARGLPPMSESEKTGNTQKVIDVSRERYAGKREEVEEKINRWHNSYEEDVAKEIAQKQSKRDQKQRKKERDRTGTPFVPPQERKPTVQVSENPFARPQNNASAPISRPPSNSNVSANVAPKTDKFEKKQADFEPKKDVYSFETNCARCGEKTKTSFKPDGVRPVYCKNCLSKAKEEKRTEVERRKQAKLEELKRLEEEERQNKTQEVSLSDALNMGAVSFSGKKIEKPQKNENTKTNDVVANDSDAKNNDEDLEEEHTIVFK